MDSSGRRLTISITYPQQIVELSKRLRYRAFKIINLMWTVPLAPQYKNLEIRINDHEGDIESIQPRNSNMADPSTMISYPVWVQFVAVPAESTVLYNAPDGAKPTYVNKDSFGNLVIRESDTFVFSIWLDGALATTADINKTTPLQLIIEFLIYLQYIVLI